MLDTQPDLGPRAPDQRPPGCSAASHDEPSRQPELLPWPPAPRRPTAGHPNAAPPPPHGREEGPAAAVCRTGFSRRRDPGGGEGGDWRGRDEGI